VEFVEEDGRFGRKLIEVDVEEMFIRLQLLPDDCKIQLGIQMKDHPGLLSTLHIDLLAIDYQDN